MSRSFNPRHLNVAEFARAGATLQGADPLQKYERLAQEGRGPEADSMVEWQATGELRAAPDHSTLPALHLVAACRLELTCQRCLGPLPTTLSVDRHFLFAADEATAAALDDDAEDDDVLALSPDFNLPALIEDELLMALPLVPHHEHCPETLPQRAQSDDYDAADAPPNPFAALAQLKGSDERH